MENAEFLGAFVARSDAVKTAFPEKNDSGLWQAWRTSDGLYAVQPLDAEKQPWGDVSVMPAEDFQYALSPLPSDDDIAAVSRRFLRANAPDLLELWYEQTRGGAGKPVYEKTLAREVAPESGPAGDVPASPQVETASGGVLTEAAAQKGPYAAPEFPERPLRAGEQEHATPQEPAGLHAQDVLQEQAKVQEQAGAQQAAPKGEGLPSLFGDSAPAQGPVVAASTPGGFTVETQDDDFYAERATILENSMRVEFAALLEHLDESPYPAIEKEVQTLLARGTGFTWKQKFMFSEFGMALRRKGKARLALVAHERALGLAPGDGHILFNLARSEYELGDIPAARIYLEQALTVLPDFAPAKSFLVFLDGQQGEKKEEA